MRLGVGLAREERLTALLDQSKWALAVGPTYFTGQMPTFYVALKPLGFWAALEDTLWATPIHAATTSIALLTVFIWWPMRQWLHARQSQRTIDHELFLGMSSQVDPVLAGHEMEGIAWGLGQTVLACPRPQIGWRSAQIHFTLERYPYDFLALERELGNEGLQTGYEQYSKVEFPRNWSQDAERLMVTCRPSAFTDNEDLRLSLRPTSWSRLQYFWTHILNEETRPKLIDAAFDDQTIEFPNTLTLHLIVLSRDSLVMLTRAHRLKRNDHPKAWACSVGEQISPEDVANLSEDCAAAWLRRSMREELTLAEGEDYSIDDARFLAVNLEADLVNFAIICVAPITLSADGLKKRLSVIAREDNEFEAVEFMDVDRIPDELVNPSRDYHPSTPIRLIYIYIFLRGQHQLREALLRAFRKSDSSPRAAQ